MRSCPHCGGCLDEGPARAEWTAERLAEICRAHRWHVNALGEVGVAVAAKLLDREESTLANRRALRQRPHPARRGRPVRYTLEELAGFLNTSDD